MLEDLGLRVIEEISTRLVGDDETWVQEFRVLGPDGAAARPRGGSATAWRSCSPPSTAATPRPTTSTGW